MVPYSPQIDILGLENRLYNIFRWKNCIFFLQKVLLVGVSWANLPEYALPECEGVISKSSFSSGKDNFR